MLILRMLRFVLRAHSRTGAGVTARPGAGRSSRRYLARGLPWAFAGGRGQEHALLARPRDMLIFGNGGGACPFLVAEAGTCSFLAAGPGGHAHFWSRKREHAHFLLRAQGDMLILRLEEWAWRAYVHGLSWQRGMSSPWPGCGGACPVAGPAGGACPVLGPGSAGIGTRAGMEARASHSLGWRRG